MEYPKYFYPKYSLNLYGLEKDFSFLTSLYSNKKLPKILMLTGSKGSGKSTLINHLLFSIFDEKNYNSNQFSLLESSILFKQFTNNIFQNILYIHGTNFKSVKVEDIRNLKSIIFQSCINKKERFIIFDDIELFNTNSLNALLKIIEEPDKNNYFIFINNKTKPLIDTIRSRSIEFKIILSEKNRIAIIEKLVKFYDIKTILDPASSQLTPGNFIKFNYICNEYNIQINNDFIENLTLLLNLYKKNKNSLFIDLTFYLAEFYFKSIKNDGTVKSNKIYEIKAFILENLNKYITFNLSQNSFINAINNKIKHG